MKIILQVFDRQWLKDKLFTANILTTYNLTVGTVFFKLISKTFLSLGTILLFSKIIHLSLIFLQLRIELFNFKVILWTTIKYTPKILKILKISII